VLHGTCYVVQDIHNIHQAAVTKSIVSGQVPESGAGVWNATAMSFMLMVKTTWCSITIGRRGTIL